MYRQIMRMVGGAKAAAVLIGLTAAVLVVATIIEARTDAATARRLVFRTTWFAFLIGLLAVNVLAAVINRFPWRWRQAGFLLTHAGIVTIITGAIVTRLASVDGTIALAEGQETAYLYEAPTGGEGRRASLTMEWPGRPAVEMSFNAEDGPGPAPEPLRIERYLVHSVDRLEVEETPVGPAQSQVQRGPAIQLVAGDDPGPDNATWLAAAEPEHRFVRFGPGLIRFVQARTPAETEQWLREPDRGRVVLDLGPQGTFTVEVAGSRGRDLPLGSTGLSVRLVEAFTHAVVEGDRLVNKSPRAVNPAVVLELSGPHGTERHTVFAFFPDFATRHRRTPGWSGAKVKYDYPRQPDEAEEETGRLVLDPDGRLYAWFVDGAGAVHRDRVEVGRPFSTPWSPVPLRVARVIPQAVLRWEVEERPAETVAEMNRPAVALVVPVDGQERRLWLRWDEERTEPVSGGWVRLYFGRPRVALGFTLRLDDFRIRTYPGSTMPSSYESDVTVTDPGQGLTRQWTIQMNRPLTVGRYTLYQSSYRQLPDGDVSVLTVSSDPGTPIAYAGFAMLIAGTLVTMVLHRLRDRARPIGPTAAALPACPGTGSYPEVPR